MYVTLLYPSCDKVNAAYYSSKDAEDSRITTIKLILQEETL